MVRKPLGRGLSALIGEDTVKTEGLVELDLDLIDPNTEQPRTRFAENALDDLAASIIENGMVQPIVIRPQGIRYQIVAGERRWRAAQRAGLRKIPVIIKDIPDEKLLELALVENIQRQELNPIEEARAFRKLIDTLGFTQEMISEKVGRERTLVATTIRLLKLPEDIQQFIEEGMLSAGHGRALLMTEDASEQRRLARSIIEMSLSVREAERVIKRLKNKSQATDTKPVKADANMKAAETKLMRRLATNVKILPKRKGQGGKIEIEYYGNDDLDRIYQTIMNA